MRIVSLIASATEIACALGARDELVGRSHECDTPADIIALPALTAPKFQTSLPSRDIDNTVKGLVRDGLAVYRVDQAALRALAPDVILTQDQCEVCAASLKDVEAAVCDWVGRKVQIVSLRPNCLADIWIDIGRVGTALAREDAAERLIASLHRRIETPRPFAKKAKVACIEWIDPVMTAGHWIPELIDHAGGCSLLARTGGPSPYVDLSEIAAADPDVIVVAPCGFDVPRSLQDMPVLANRPDWKQLRAVREGRVAVADGNRYFNRPSPAVADTVDILEDILSHFGAKTPPRFAADIWRVWRS
ncbi:MAG: cobalamin-binding protein [Rhodospirillaceae bacterium]